MITEPGPIEGVEGWSRHLEANAVANTGRLPRQLILALPGFVCVEIEAPTMEVHGRLEAGEPLNTLLY